MPSTATSFLCTFIGLVIVGAALTGSMGYHAISLRAAPETAQLKKTLSHVAAKGSELLTLVTTMNSTVRVYLQLPSKIGDKAYWVRVRNDSLHAWLEGSLGLPSGPGRYRVFFPGRVSASGCYIGGYGAAELECYMNGSVPQINLVSLGGDAE